MDTHDSVATKTPREVRHTRGFSAARGAPKAAPPLRLEYSSTRRVDPNGRERSPYLTEVQCAPRGDMADKPSDLTLGQAIAQTSETKIRDLTHPNSFPPGLYSLTSACPPP